MLWTISGKIVFIPVEIKNREWTAKVLLANYFLSKGYSVFLGMLWNMDAYTKGARHSCYVAKSLYRSSEKLFRELRGHDNYVIAWDEEGLIYDTDEHYVPQQLYKETLLQCDTIVAWGDRHKKTIDSFIGNAVPVLSLGNPRIDLLNRSMAEKIYAEESAYIQEKYGSGYILVNSNFVLVLREDYDYLEAISSMNGETAESTAAANEYIRFQQALYPRFLAAIQRLSKEFPDRKIILRPHPQERVEEWQRRIAGCTNVFIEKAFSVSPWLLHAACVVHSGCTTGMEAVIMGKNAISYQPPLPMGYMDTVPDSVSQIARDEESLLALVRRCLAGEDVAGADAQKKQLIAYYVSADGNKSCCERIAATVDSHLSSGSCTFPYSFSAHLRDSLRRSSQQDFNVEFAHVTMDECRRDLERIKKALGFSYSCRFVRLEDNEFLLLNKDTKLSRQVEKLEKLRRALRKKKHVQP